MEIGGWICAGLSLPLMAGAEVAEFRQIVDKNADSNRIFYIRTDGDDSNSGLSSGAAWKTLAKLNNVKFQTGDSVLIEGGQTFQGSIALQNIDSLKLQGTGTSPAVIDSGDGGGLSLTNVSNIEVSQLKFMGSGTTNTANGVAVVADAQSTHFSNVSLHDLEVSGYGKYGIYMASNWTDSGFTDVDLNHIDAHHNVLGGLFITAPYPAIPHKHVHVDFVRAYYNTGDPSLPYHSGSGILLNGVDHATIEHSEAYENGALSHPVTSGGPLGIWAWNARNVVIQFNKSHHNHCGCGADGGGFDLDGGVTDSIIQYNFAAYNDGYGFQFAQFPGAPTFARNIIYNNISFSDTVANEAGAIHMWGPVGGNSFVSDNMVYSTNSKNPLASQVFFDDWTGDGLFFMNNVYYIDQGNPILLMRNSSGSNLYMNQNLYASSGALTDIWWLGQTYNNLNAWQQLTGLEKQSIFTANRPVDVTALNLLDKPVLDVTDFTRAHEIFVQ